MANQLYGYTSSAYGGGATSNLYASRSGTEAYIPSDTSLYGTSRYLSGDLLSSSSAISSSLLYNPESYSTRIAGLSGNTPSRSYGPPGVDVASAVVPADSLYAGLKRASAECKKSTSLFSDGDFVLFCCNALTFSHCAKFNV